MLTKADPSYGDLLSLPQPCNAASLLFVVNASTGVLAGEAVFDAAQLGALDMRIRTAMQQVQLHLLCTSVLAYQHGNSGTSLSRHTTTGGYGLHGTQDQTNLC